MSLDTLVAVVVTFFWILPTAGQTDPTGINLVEEFKHQSSFFQTNRNREANHCGSRAPAITIRHND